MANLNSALSFVAFISPVLAIIAAASSSFAQAPLAPQQRQLPPVQNSVQNSVQQPQPRPVPPPAAGQVLPAPFELDVTQRAQRDEVLRLWEEASDKIKIFQNTFIRKEYDPVFGPGQDTPLTESSGRLTYHKPDEGEFRIDKVLRWDKAQQRLVEQSEEQGERWVCDGKAVYEFDAEKKQLIVRPLPPDLQGAAIANGPLPFLFGAKADTLRNRYHIRLTQIETEKIFLEAYPRFPQDAQNFQRVDLILNRAVFLPEAMQVHSASGQNRTVYIFDVNSAKVNGLLQGLLGAFGNTTTPFGWKKITEEIPQPTPAQPQARATPTGVSIPPR